MARSRKEMAQESKVPVDFVSPPVSKSRLPSAFRFPLAVILSLSLSSLFYSVAADFGAGELASVSRSVNGWFEVGGLVLWKTVELAVGWSGNYDGIDLASLTLLTHFPPLALLMTFYQIRPSVIATSLGIDLLATYLPFRLLRPLAPVHNSSAPKDAVPNRSIIRDAGVRTYTSLLAASIYSVALFASFKSWLPVHLVTYFVGIKDITGAHEAILPYTFLTLIPVGYAAREFIFTPSEGSGTDLGDIKNLTFNPETATLRETFVHNFWGYSQRTKTLIKRTTVLIAATAVNTFLQVFVTIQGAEVLGAAGWSGLWAAAAAVTGLAFWWVGDV